MYGPWLQTCRWGLAPADLCTKSMQHLCKHMAFFRRRRQSRRGLQIDVAGNLDCPQATQKWLWRLDLGGGWLRYACVQQHVKRQAAKTHKMGHSELRWSFFVVVFVVHCFFIGLYGLEWYINYIIKHRMTVDYCNNFNCPFQTSQLCTLSNYFLRYLSKLDPLNTNVG